MLSSLMDYVEEFDNNMKPVAVCSANMLKRSEDDLKKLKERLKKNDIDRIVKSHVNGIVKPARKIKEMSIRERRIRSIEIGNRERYGKLNEIEHESYEERMEKEKNFQMIEHERIYLERRRVEEVRKKEEEEQER
jgi:regulator of PEP synthase PpsR (kinase-PPPase family)